ncbi:MAG: branched-chain amino acid ABC transporter permease, partial [Hyphomicrobiales bacterium]|nr:branched-chain amino acid ABC transporter permease [Hyphomicrobiales bacterium]
MSDATMTIAPPVPSASDRLKFFGVWVIAAAALIILPKIFSSGGSLTTFSLIGIS